MEFDNLLEFFQRMRVLFPFVIFRSASGYVRKFGNFHFRRTHVAESPHMSNESNPEKPQDENGDKTESPLICGECLREFSRNRDLGSHFVECPYCGYSNIPSPTLTTAAIQLESPETVALPPRYEFRGVLGWGAFGIVCRAWDKTLQRLVAIKAPKSTTVRSELFLHEARASSRLRHPNIVRVFDFGENDGQVYLVSDLIEGQTLRHWLSSQTRTFAEICEMMVKIARAVGYSHDNGVVHRDLKPGNIVVDQNGEPNILDFGLSHSIRQPDDAIAATGKPFGTPAFMSPEQVIPYSTDIDARSDVYSLGVILFQLLTKQLPFSGSPDKILSDILTVPPKSPRECNDRVPLALDAICRKAMSKEKSSRYGQATLLADDLQCFLADRRVYAYPHWEFRLFRGFLHRNWTPIALASALALLVWFGWIATTSQRSDTVALQRVMIQSSPAGASLTWVRFDEASAQLLKEEAVRSKAGQPLELKPGYYQVSAELDGEYFDVLRTIPQPKGLSKSIAGVPTPHYQFYWDHGTAVLTQITIIPAAALKRELCQIEGGRLDIPNDPSWSVLFAGKSSEISDFLIDCKEVTFGDIRRVFPQIVGLPDEPDDISAHSIPHDVAVAYAEQVGMNLPTFWEMAWAASNRGKTRYSWGSNLPPFSLEDIINGRLEFSDKTPTEPEIINLQLARAEWTITPRIGIEMPPTAPNMGPSFIPGSLTQYMAFGHVPSLTQIGQSPVEISPATMPGGYYDATVGLNNLGFRCLRRKLPPD